MLQSICKIALSVILLFFSVPGFAQNLTAFPGAEGYGKFTLGGPGGEGSGPRTVVFRVSGTIAISSKYTKNIILDHVLASWSVDECMSIYHAGKVP